MMAILALTLKKTIALFALVSPLAMIPVFLAAVRQRDLAGRTAYARAISATVTLALFVAAFFGMPLLNIMGVSLGAMQVGGGIIVLLLAIAMVLGKETSFKGSPAADGKVREQDAAVIPLAVPLLAGPAAFSYVMANSDWRTSADLIHVVVPILAVGISCWLIFNTASHAGDSVRQSKLDLIERISGFVLATIAIEMMATGLRGLFPILVPGA